MNSPQWSPEAQAQSCWALANSYSAAAASLLKARSAEIFLPTTLLLLHALELHLKSFLISRGLREKELRRAGHDLLTCLRLCRQHGLASYVTLSWLQQMQIGRVNVYYKDKELEYFVSRAKHFGNIDRLVETVDQVAKAVFNPITEESFRALSQPAT